MREIDVKSALLHLVSHPLLYSDMKSIGHIPQPCIYVQSTIIKWTQKAYCMVPVAPDICKCMCRIWIPHQLLFCYFGVLCFPISDSFPPSPCSFPPSPCSFPLALWREGCGTGQQEDTPAAQSQLKLPLKPTWDLARLMVASSASVVYFASQLTSAATLWLH